MKISLSPIRSDENLTVEKNGDRLRINGELFNFNPIPDGGDLDASLTNCEWVVGLISRVNGEIELTLRLPHGPNPSNSVAFPEPLENVPDGIVNIPFDPPEEPTYDIETLKANVESNPYKGYVFTEMSDDSDLDEDENNVDA